MFVEKAFEDKTLTLGPKVMFARLLLKHYHNKSKRCDPSERILAADLKLSVRQIQRFIRQLQKCGWLSVRRRFNTSNQYHFNWDCDGSMTTNSVNLMTTKLVGDDDKSGSCRRQNRYFNDDKNGGLTIERTNERTNKRTHTEGVCASDSFSDERKVLIQDSNLSDKEVPHGDASDSLALSEDDDADLVPFAHLANDDFPSHHKNECPCSQVNISSPYTKENDSSLHENINLTPLHEACERFWHYYPRKVGEKHAIANAFVRAVEVNGGDAAGIVEGAHRHANWCGHHYKKQEQQRYIKKPINWLNENGWTDTAQPLDPYDGCSNADAARAHAARSAKEKYGKLINGDGDLSDYF